MSGPFKAILGVFIILIGLYIYVSGWFNGFFANNFKLLLFMFLGNIPGLIILVGLVMLILGMTELGSK